VQVLPHSVGFNNSILTSAAETGMTAYDVTAKPTNSLLTNNAVVTVGR